MTFSLREISNFFGRPVCLYEFQWGNTFYRYTNADRDIEHAGHSWTATPISDNGFTQGGSADDFVVTMPRSLPIPDLFRLTPPAIKIVLKCWRFHRDDPDDEAIVYWIGTVGNVKGKDAVTAEVLGLPISKTIRRTGLRLCWEVDCPHALYGPGCKANRNDFRTDTTITALTGTTITVASLGAWAGERYAGGFIEWEANEDGTIDRRGIESHNGGSIFTLLSTTDRLVAGQEVSLFLGCDLTAETCDDIFNNLANHGGHKYMAKDSPFDGKQVF